MVFYVFSGCVGCLSQYSIHKLACASVYAQYETLLPKLDMDITENLDRTILYINASFEDGTKPEIRT